MQDVRFVELHTELFFAGKNFGKKLTPQTTAGLVLRWDAKEKWFEVTYKDRTGYVLPSNVAFWEPATSVEVVLPKNEHKTEDVAGRKKAQVSTPMDHVFRGEGHGKVRQ